MSQYWWMAMLEKADLTPEQAEKILATDWYLYKDLKAYLQARALGTKPLPKKLVDEIARRNAYASRDYKRHQLGAE